MKTSHTTHSQALEMPENESRNPRLVTHPRVFQSSYNPKDPPKIGSRRGPVSREALSSFSKFLEHFHPEAHTQYLRERMSIKRGSRTLGELYTRYDRKCAELQLRVYAARHSKSLKVIPSSVELDPVPAPQGLKSSPPSVAHELPAARKPLETGTPISSPRPHPSVCVKPVEQPIKTVLSREPLKGNSLMGATPPNRVVLVPAPKRVNTRTSGKPPIIKTKVNVEKDAKARRHSPMPKAAPTLLKSTPVSSVRARTPPSSSPSSRVISTLRTSHAISTHQVVNKTTHQKYETRSRVSRELASSRF